MVLYSCTIAKREADVKTLVGEASKLADGHNISFQPLIDFVGTKPTSEETEQQSEDKKKETKGEIANKLKEKELKVSL